MFRQIHQPGVDQSIAGFFIGEEPSMEARESSAKRGYGSRWQKARATFLSHRPLCADHAARGHVVVATVVDHIVPHRGDQTLFWDTSNWQSLCKLCHDSAKQRLEKGGALQGCNLSGLPLDPSHHWVVKR